MPNCPSCNGANSPGTTFCRSCGASIPEPATLNLDLERNVRSLLDQGKKIEAVKLYKDHTGSSLKDAKDAVEALQAGGGPLRPAEADADWEAEVLQLMRQGEKINAVRLYRDRTGSTLFDAKQAVEEMAERHGITMQGGGCSGVLAVSIVTLIAIAVVATLVILKQ